MSTFKQGSILLPKINFESLDFEYRKFQDENTLKRWKEIGHLYEKYSGLTLEKNKSQPEWVDIIEKEFDLESITSCVYCMTPGTIMPEHQDFYKKYRSLYNLSDSKNICRVIVFLEDWKSGHYFEIDKTPIVNWKAGDYISWKNSTIHMAANVGSENRYTLQITGIDE